MILGDGDPGHAICNTELATKILGSGRYRVQGTCTGNEVRTHKFIAGLGAVHSKMDVVYPKLDVIRAKGHN